MAKRNDRTARHSVMTHGEPDAVRVACPVRRAGRRNPPAETLDRALRFDPYTKLAGPERGVPLAAALGLERQPLQRGPVQDSQVLPGVPGAVRIDR